MKLALVLIFSCSLFSQTKAVDPVLKKEIQHMLETIHMNDMVHQQIKLTMPGMITLMKQNPNVSPQFADEFSRRFPQALSNSEIDDRVVSVYAAHFTLAEIKSIEAFYDSPAGKKLLESQPALMSELAQQLKKYGEETGLKVGQEIMKDHPEYAVKKDSTTAPAPPPEL